MNYMPIRIAGTGSYLPKTVKSNEEISRLNNCDPTWAERKIGIKSRHISDADEKSSDLAVAAARKAIENSGCDLHCIDLIIVATATPDMQAPSTAAIVQSKLGILKCTSFDVAAVCSGFLYASSVAIAMLNLGQFSTAMVIGVDQFSKITDWTKKDSFFFGDGAGAVIYKKDDGANNYFRFHTLNDPVGVRNFQAQHSGHFEMAGREVYDSALNLITSSINYLFDRSPFTRLDVTHVVPHQPSIHLLKAISVEASIPFDKFHWNMDRAANTAGATIPILLDEIHQQGKINRGDLCLMLAAGAGMTGGSALFTF